MELLNSKRILITTTTLQRTFGGRTKSLLQRARIFDDHGLKVLVFSTNYNDDYQDTFDLYRAKGHIKGRIEIGNLFEMLGNWTPDVKNNYRLIVQRLFGDETVYRKVTGNEKVSYYEGDSLIYTINFHDYVNGTVKSIDAFEQGRKRPVRRYVVNQRGNVRRVRHYEFDSWQLEHEDYLDVSGNVVARMRQVNDKKQMQHVKLSSDPMWVNNKQFIATFLNSFVNKQDIIINDARGLDYPIRLVEQIVPKIYVMHNPHLADPLDLNSGIKGSFKSIIRPDLKVNETIVSLTDDQKNNILQYVPELATRIVVIGHSVTVKELKVERHGLQNIVGIIGRLSTQKNLSDAIKAFNLFHLARPEYALNIYGKGDEEVELRQLVHDLGIEKFVHFLGYTDDVDAAYQSVDFTLNTSYFEGFPLAIIESISNGTPVLSYPVNFGPTTILQGQAGRITNDRTPESLADTMLEEVQNPTNYAEVIKRSSDFSVEEFWNQWRSLMERAIK